MKEAECPRIKIYEMTMVGQQKKEEEEYFSLPLRKI